MANVTPIPVDYDPFASDRRHSGTPSWFPRESESERRAAAERAASLKETERGSEFTAGLEADIQMDKRIAATGFKGVPFVSRGSQIAAELKARRQPVFPVSDTKPSVTPIPVDYDPFATLTVPKTEGSRTGDVGVDIFKGVVGLGESVIGIADLLSFGAAGEAMSALGYDPNRSRAILSDLYSNQRKAENKEVSDAEGFLDKAGALLSNPIALAGIVTEAIPGTIGIAGVGKMVAMRAFDTAKAAALAGGLGEKAAKEAGIAAVKAVLPRILTTVGAAEGAQAAGSIAEQARQEGREWADYVLPAVGAGVATAAITKGAGTIAGKIGLGGDLETSIAAGEAASRAAGSFPRRLSTGAVREGALEEMPQSAQEQVAQNIALGKPAGEGVGGAAATGALTGGVMGGVYAGARGPRPEPTPAAAPPAATPAPAAPGVAPAPPTAPIAAPPETDAERQARRDAWTEQWAGEQDRERKQAAWAAEFGQEPMPEVAPDAEAGRAILSQMERSEDELADVATLTRQIEALNKGPDTPMALALRAGFEKRLAALGAEPAVAAPVAVQAEPVPDSPFAVEPEPEVIRPPKVPKPTAAAVTPPQVAPIIPETGAQPAQGVQEQPKPAGGAGAPAPVSRGAQIAAEVKKRPAAAPTAGAAKSGQKPAPSQALWQMTRDEFAEAVARGKLHKATGRAVAGESEAKTPLKIGELNGYSSDDIAHFYAVRRGYPNATSKTYDPIEEGRQQLIQDAVAEGRLQQPKKNRGQRIAAEVKKPEPRSAARVTESQVPAPSEPGEGSPATTRAPASPVENRGKKIAEEAKKPSRAARIAQERAAKEAADKADRDKMNAITERQAKELEEMERRGELPKMARGALHRGDLSFSPRVMIERRATSAGQSDRVQFLTDEGLAALEFFRDSAIAKTAVKQGFQSLNVQDQREVQARVLSAVNDNEIVGAIVRTVPINVMNNLIEPKFSSKVLLDQKAMLLDVLSVQGMPSISRKMRIINSLLPAIRDLGHELRPAKLGANRLRGISPTAKPAGENGGANAAGILGGTHDATPNSGVVTGAGFASTKTAPILPKNTVAGLSESDFRQEFVETFGEKAADRIIGNLLVLVPDQTNLPEHVVPYLRDGDKVYGLYDPKTNRTYGVLANLKKGMVRGLTAHELGIHYGLKRMLGDQKYDQVLLRLEAMRASGNQAAKDAYEQARREAVTRDQVPEEALAYLVTNQPKMGIVKTIVVQIKAFLFREFGIGAKSLTDADMAMLAKAAVIKAGMHGKRPGELLALFSRAMTFTPEFKKWFDQSVVTKTGKPGDEPLTMAHSTNATGVAEFRPFSHFGTVAAANERAEILTSFSVNVVGRDPGAFQVLPVYLKIENPLRMPDLASIDDSTGKPIDSEDSTVYAEDDESRPYPRGWEGEEAIATTLLEMGVIDINEFEGHRSNDEALRLLVEKGYDGVVYENVVEDAGNDSYIVFRPEQIKSVFNERPTDSPNISFARNLAQAQATQPGNRASWDATEPTKLDKFVRVLQDRFIDVKRVQNAISNAAGALQDAIDVYLQEELFHGRAAKGVHDFLDDELKPLLKDMTARGIGMNELEVYLHARHAEEANDHIAAINPNLPDGGSGMMTADAQNHLAGLDPQKRQALEAVAAKVDQINEHTRQMIVAYGLESHETIDGWKQMFDHYVPLHREDMGDGPGNGQGFSVRGRFAPSRTGSARRVVDIIANIAQQRERAIVRGEKNRVALALMGLAEANPNPDFWRVDKPPMIQRMDERTGILRSMVDPLYRSRENVVMARLPDPQTGEVRDHSVIFNEFDERAARMSAALKKLDAHDLGEVLGTSAKITRFFAAINTQYNPVFGVVNLIRDTQGALFNLTTTPIAGKQAEVVKNTVDALRGIYIDTRAMRVDQHPTSSWAQLWEEFQTEGGQTGYRDMFRTSKDRSEEIEREIHRVTRGKTKGFGRAIFDWLSDYNSAMENAVRLAAYKVAKESGLSNQRAASLAKNLTVNFNRKGQIGLQAGALYAFFNASVQGTARMAETLMGPAGKKIITGGVMLGAMQALMLAAAGFDDDEPPDFVRERNLILPIGDKKYLTLPMPLGLHILPNLGRVPMEFVLSGFRDPHKRVMQLVNVFLEAFNPVGNAGLSLQTIAPTAIDPLTALAENKDWTGKPIAREDFNKLAPTPGHTRAKETASEFSKSVSRALNWLSGGTSYKPGIFSPTPDQIDYLLGQVTGGLGRETMKVEQVATSAITGEELPTYKIPLLARFYGSSKGQAPQASAFYDNLRELNEHEAEIKGRRKAGEPVADYYRENPESRLVGYANAVERQVSALRKQRRNLLEKDADKSKIRQLDAHITAAMTRFNDQVRQIQTR